MNTEYLLVHLCRYQLYDKCLYDFHTRPHVDDNSVFVLKNTFILRKLAKCAITSRDKFIQKTSNVVGSLFSRKLESSKTTIYKSRASCFSGPFVLYHTALAALGGQFLALLRNRQGKHDNMILDSTMGEKNQASSIT